MRRPEPEEERAARIERDTIAVFARAEADERKNRWPKSLTDWGEKASTVMGWSIAIAIPVAAMISLGSSTIEARRAEEQRLKYQIASQTEAVVTREPRAPCPAAGVTLNPIEQELQRRECVARRTRGG